MQVGRYVIVGYTNVQTNLFIPVANFLINQKNICFKSHYVFNEHLFLITVRVQELMFHFYCHRLVIIYTMTHEWHDAKNDFWNLEIFGTSQVAGIRPLSIRLRKICFALNNNFLKVLQLNFSWLAFVQVFKLHKFHP